MNEDECVYIKTVSQLSPSYLRDFIPNKGLEKIILVHLDKSNNECKLGSPKKILLLEETQINTSLDVTGSPLEVNLKGDETLVIEKDEIFQQWSESENKHFPMPISKATEYLNSNSKNQKPIFVVCDGKNALKTVLLGVFETTKKHFTCTINILGLLSIKDENLLISAMEKSHYLLMGTKRCIISYETIFKYFIFGTFLHNVKIDMECYGSICIQTLTTSKCDLENPSNQIKEMKLVLQVKAGHQNSSVAFLWKELSLLQKYIDIPDKTFNADTQICENPLTIDEINESLREIISTNSIKREPKSEFNLDNIRQINIMDKLWNILKYCQNLNVLRNALHYFFEELAESTSYNKVPLGNSRMAMIINGIIDGKLAVPTMNYTQALEFLFEIGAEKMKNDYQTISKHFYTSSCTEITNKWNQLQNKLDVDKNSRKTRVTQCLKGNQINIKSCREKINYLGKLHVATELIYLVHKEAYLPEEAFDYFCSRVYENYVAKDASTLDFKDLQDTPLCEFDIVININKNDIVKGKLADFCSVRLASVDPYLEAETVYVLSKYSIIPPAIYNDYDVIDTEEMHYYAYKMESYNESI